MSEGESGLQSRDKKRRRAEIAKHLITALSGPPLAEGVDAKVARDLDLPKSSVYVVKMLKGPDGRYSSGRRRTIAELEEIAMEVAGEAKPRVSSPVSGPKGHRRPQRTEARSYLKIAIGGDGWHSQFSSLDKAFQYLQVRKSNSSDTMKQLSSLLYRLCEFSKKTPDELVRLDKEELERLVDTFVKKEIWDHSEWGKTANTSVAILKVFFRENGFRRERGEELELTKYRVPPRTLKREEYIPDPTEAIRMANACGGGSRDRALIMILAFSGLRNSTLRALRYRDVKDELLAGKENLLIRVRRDMKKIIPGACKGEIPYYTFSTKTTTEALKHYLEERLRKNGSIDDDAPLFPTTFTWISNRDRREHTPLSQRELEFIVQKAARLARIEKWNVVTPHKLRKTFHSFLRNQPPEARLDGKDQEFLVGHMLPGSQDTYYDKTKTEEMRTKFAKLVIERDPEYQTMREIARSMGIDPDMARVELASRLGRDPTLPEEIESLRGGIKDKVDGRGERRKETRMVDEQELEGLLYSNEGW